MPPRDPTRPQGTDQIVDSDMTVGGPDRPSSLGSGGFSTGGDPLGTGSAGGAGAYGGTMGSADTLGGAGTTGTSDASFDKRTGATGSDHGASSTGKAADTIVNQLKDQVSTLKGQAGEQARTFAVDGKQQATDLLQSLAQIIQEAAASIEERLGGQYAGFGHRAADQVNALAGTISERSVDDLIENARAFVRRSPTAAISVAALIGFAISRVARSSFDEARGTGPRRSGSDGSDGFADEGLSPTGGMTETRDPFAPGSPGAAGGTGWSGTSTSGGFGAGGTGTTGGATSNTGGLGGSGTGGGGNAPSY